MTLTPVALVKASSSATNASSSACTKYFHRSMASCAFFSGFHGAVCAHAFAHSSSAGPASAPAAAAAVAPFTSVRRVKSVMISFLRYSLSLPRERGFGSLPPPLAGRVGEEALTTVRAVEYAPSLALPRKRGREFRH